jgi:hypothetical protein
MNQPLISAYAEHFSAGGGFTRIAEARQFASQHLRGSQENNIPVR